MSADDIDLDVEIEDDSTFDGIPSDTSQSDPMSETDVPNKFTFQGAGSTSQALQESLTAPAAYAQFGTAHEVILEINQMLYAARLNRDTRQRKVYVSMPDKFHDKIGDYADTWLEQFQTLICQS